LRGWHEKYEQAWPTIVAVDRKGVIRYSHIGEGAYDKTASVIKQLLAEKS